MTDTSTSPVRVAELRSAFDRTYALPHSSQSGEQIENLLAVRIAGNPLAIRVQEISGLARSKKIVHVPSPVPELLGVVGIRGGFLPVYSLEALLGYTAGAAPGRWLALCGAKEPVGLAFSDFEGYLRVPGTDIYTAAETTLYNEHIEHVVRSADSVRAIVSIPQILEVIKRRCDKTRVSKEL